MSPATKLAVEAVLKTDSSIDPKTRARILSRLDQNGDEPEHPPEQPDRIIRRDEAARLLGRSCRGVDMLTRQGHLRKVKFPGRQRAAGFRLSDLSEFIATAQ
jgi:hypothetical protein